MIAINHLPHTTWGRRRQITNHPVADASGRAQ